MGALSGLTWSEPDDEQSTDGKTRGERLALGIGGGISGLSREEGYFVELKLKLADELKKLRARRNITQQRLAASIGSSQSRVAKMERGDVGAKPKSIAA